ncbi:MAG: lasso RiPP family leader peptide-containing protein [Gemmatimonas sp.]|nr:lasso RiPP family leader peptide-containing protein [Gemmatimonas sp.]
MEVQMYEKPVLERFGSLRELTLIGFGADGDGGIGIPFLNITIADGCNIIPKGDCGRS